MKTPRFNVFNQIHKGLRALLFDTALTMQQTDFCQVKEALPVLEQTELLLNLFDAHAYHEDSCILDEVQKHSPALVKEFESEHETDLQLSNQLRQKIDAFKTAISPEEKYQNGYALFYALNDFIAFNLKHMNKEEQLLNHFLWKHFTDAEILNMEQKIQQNIPPDKLLTYFKWMIKGINDTELILWLTAVRNEAPEFVVNALLQECEQHLPAGRWTFIQQQIADCAIA